MSIFRRTVMALIAVAGIALSFGGNALGQEPNNFQTVIRPGSVDLGRKYDLAGLKIPEEQIHRLLPKDAIPALVDPKREKVAANKWLKPDSRIVVVEIDEEVLGVPLQILDQHEILNATIGKTPVAVTYCPLCDSATVFLRTVKDQDGKEIVLEFGVSGALFNSNVLMFDRTTLGLWSQLGMKAMSGSLTDTQLEMLPVNLQAFSEFVKSHPDAEVVSSDTGRRRNYSRSVYGNYFATDELMVPVFEYGVELPRKTLGVGIATDKEAWFVPVDSIGGAREIVTPLGNVVVSKNDAGIEVVELPAGVHAAQTFYYSWSAFYPDSQIVRNDKEPEFPAEVNLWLEDRSHFESGLMEAERLRQKLLSRGLNDKPVITHFANAINSLKKALCSDKFQDQVYSIEGFECTPEKLENQLAGKEPLPVDAFAKFDGKWFGKWGDSEVNHDWRPTQVNSPPILDNASGLFVAATQYAWISDGFGWNYLASTSQENRNHFVLGMVYYFSAPNYKEVTGSKPHVGFADGPTRLIWITEREIFLEEVFESEKASGEQYVITAIYHDLIGDSPSISSRATQAVYTRDPGIRPAFKNLEWK